MPPIEPPLPVPDISPGTPDGVLLAQQIARALGPAYQSVWQDGSHYGGAGAKTKAGVEALVEGFALNDDGAAVLARALAEAFPDTATDTLAEWETRLGLPSNRSAPIADRRAALLGKVRAILGAKTTSILTAVQAIDSGAVLYETTAQKAADAGDPRLVHEAGLVIAATWNASEKRSAIRAIIEQMKPVYARINIASGRGFFTDGYLDSRTDDTLLGA